MGCSGSAPPLRRRDTRYRAGEKKRKSWGTGSCRLISGEKILLAKGVSCPGPKPTARRWLIDLSLALQDSQHLPCVGKHPATVCTGQAPRHAQPFPAFPWQLDSGLCAGPISSGLRAMPLPRWGKPHACGRAAPCCTGLAAGGQTGSGLTKIHPGAHEFLMNF